MTSEWQPIETAPKGEKILALFGGRIAEAQWVEDRHKKQPRPHWRSYELARFWGERWLREHPATHWMLLPELPK